jgi:hypothetical protein
VSILSRLLACLLVLIPASLNAQTPRALAWDYDVNLTGVTFQAQPVDAAKTPIGSALPLTPTKTATGYEAPLPVLPLSVTHLAVRACNPDGCSPLSNAVQLVAQTTCLITDLPTVFVTRWEHTTGRPGSRFRINFQLGGSSPITEIQGRISGQTMATVTGTDLRETGGIWLTAPAAGTFPISVWVKAANGCTKEASALVNLVVK